MKIETRTDGQSKHLISRIVMFEGDTTVSANYNKDGNKDKMFYFSDYHGDHSENWVVLTRDGKEIERHNTKYIATMEWSDRLNV